MRKLLPWAIGLVFAPYGFGQLDPYTVTVTASRTLTVQADQVVFNVVVDAPMTSGLSDVVAAVGSVGITASNLSSVYTTSVVAGGKPQQVLEWSFTLATAFATMKDTIMALGNLQQALAKQKSGMIVSFNVVGTQASTDLQNTQTCPVASLMADARAEAQKLGNAAGMGVGKVLALSDAGVQAPVAYLALGARIGTFVGLASFVNPADVIQNCLVTVKFQLIGG